MNPYTPNAGARPQVVVGRDDQLQSFDLLLRRLKLGRSEQSMIITGLRGVGKTVLLGQFRSKALAAGWVVLELEVSKHDDQRFRLDVASRLRTTLLELSPKAKWNERFQHALSVLRSFTLSVDQAGTLSVGMSAAPADGYADHGDLTLDLTDLLVAVGEAARSVNRGVVLLFDEIQFLQQPQLEALIAALHKLVQRELPVTLVGAGLPQIAELAGDAKSYAERLFKFPAIGRLNDQDARRALLEPAEQEGADFADEALDRAVELTAGYPYFIQELGHALWGVAEGTTITAADLERTIPIYESKLDASFFRVRLDRATEMQRAYLRAMAGLGPLPQKAADVAAVLGRQSTQLGPTRAELINMGLLYTPEHGFAAFTVPHFDQFMLRAMPVLSIPDGRPRRTPPRKGPTKGPGHAE
ncbi:MAG: ATP-binding protein [Micropruina sp.]